MRGNVMDKKEKERCVTAMFLLNIAAWLIFLIMDAAAELLLNEDGVLDYGFFTIPCVLTVLYIIVEKRLFAMVRFKARYNLLLTVSFVLTAAVLGGIVWFMCLTMNIWPIPQANRGWISLNGIEYLIFPFTYGIISLILGFVIKLIAYIVYRRKKV